MRGGREGNYGGFIPELEVVTLGGGGGGGRIRTCRGDIIRMGSFRERGRGGRGRSQEDEEEEEEGREHGEGLLDFPFLSQKSN